MLWNKDGEGLPIGSSICAGLKQDLDLQKRSQMTSQKGTIKSQWMLHKKGNTTHHNNYKEPSTYYASGAILNAYDFV